MTSLIHLSASSSVTDESDCESPTEDQSFYTSLSYMKTNKDLHKSYISHSHFRLDDDGFVNFSQHEQTSSSHRIDASNPSNDNRHDDENLRSCGSSITSNNRSHSSSDVDTLNNHDEDSKVGSKRPRNKDYLVTIPRTDIRRMYPHMFINIFNSHDPFLVHSFFMTYAVPQMIGTHHMHNVSFDSLPSSPSSKSVNEKANINSNTPSSLPPVPHQGADLMALFYATMLQLNPDQIMSLYLAEINVQVDKRVTEIVCHVRHDFTQLFAVNPMSVTDELMQFVLKEKETIEQFLQWKQQEIQALEARKEEETRVGHVEGDSSMYNHNNSGNDANKISYNTHVSSNGKSSKGTARQSKERRIRKKMSHRTRIFSYDDNCGNHTTSTSDNANNSNKHNNDRKACQDKSNASHLFANLPDIFTLYRLLHPSNPEIPRLLPVQRVSMQCQLVIVVDALRRVLSLEFRNPQVSIVPS